MADINYSIAMDAGQAIQSAGKLTNALKHLDSAIDSANKSLGGANKTLKGDFVNASKEVSSATSLLSKTFDQFQKTFTASMAGIRTSNTEVRQSIRAVNKDFKESNSVLITASAAYDKMFKAADNLEAHLTKLSNQTHITSRDLEQLKKLQSSFDSAKLTATSTSGATTSASAVLNSAGIQKMLDVQTQLRAVNSEINHSVAQFNQLQAETKELTEYSSLLGDVLFDLRHKLEGMQKGTPAYRKLADGVTRLENSYTKLNEAIDANDAKLDSMKKSISLAKTSHANLTNEFSRSQNHFEAAATSLAGYTAKTKELTVVESRLAEKVAEVNNKLAIQTAAEKQQNLVASMMYGTVPTKFKQPSIDLTGAAKATGALLTVGKAARSALYGLNAVRIAFNLAFAASGISLGTRTVATFDQTLADLSSTVRDVSVPIVDMNYQLNALKLTMEELGATSRYTTTEAGQGMIYMAQAGLNAAEIVQAASHVLDLAVASNTSLARSSDIVIQTMRTFDIQAEDAWKVTDTLAVGAKESVTSIEELAQALKFVGPVAHTMGVQVNTVVAALGTLSDSGLQASMAGTGLRRIISEIVNPTYKARNILEAAGLTMDKLDIQGKGLVEVLRNIKNANLSVGQSFAIWGDRGTPALQTILGNFEEFERKLSKMDFNAMGFRGSANRMRTEREDTLSGQFLAAKSAIQEFIIKFSEYTNAIENGKNILAYFAENLRLFNTDIGTGLHSLAKWGAALIAAGITIQKLNHPMVQLKNGVSSLKAAFNSFIATPRQWALGIQTMNQFTYGVNSLNAAALAGPGIFAKLGNSLSVLILKYRAAAVAAGIFGKAIGLLASLASGAVAALLAAGITSIITATDRATDAMERLKEVTAMYFKDSASHGQSAVQVMREYADSLKSVSKSALEVRKVGLQADFTAVAGSLSQENIYGGSYLGNYEMTKLLFGMNAKELTKLYDSEKGRSRIKSMLESYDKMGISGTQYSGKNMTDDMRKRLDSEIDRIRTLLVLKEQMLKLEKELNERSDTAKRVEAEKSALERLSESGKDAHKSLLTFSQAMRGIDSKELSSALDKATSKIYELKHQFSTTEANELFASFSKAIPNFTEFFDFEGTTLTTKLKDDWKERIRILAEAQGQLEKSGEIKVDFLKSLGLDETTVKKTVEYFNQLGKVYRELKEAQVKDSLFKFSANVSVQESIAAVGTTAEDVSKKLQEIFSDEDLSKLNIRIENGASSVEMKTEHMSVATALLRANVRDAIDSILKDFGRLNAVNLKKAVEAMKVTNNLPKKLGKDVMSFARQFNLDPKTFDLATGEWTTGAHGTSKEDLNDLFKHSRSDTDSKRKTKWENDIASQIAELGLKYKQYYAEIFTGSDSQVKIKKLEIEQLKEESDLISKAAALGISSSDQRIQSLIAENKRVTDLRIAYEKFKAPFDLAEAKGSADLAEAQIHGAEAYGVQIDNLNRKLQNLKDLQKNWSIEGSEQWHNYRKQIAETQHSLEDLKKKLEEIRMASRIELLMKTGSVAQTRKARVEDIDRQIAELDAQRTFDMTSAEFEAYQNKRKLLEHERHRAADTEPWRAIPETLNQMADQYSEWAMYSNLVSQGFDLMTESVINFITTGKFSFSEFTKQVGTMLVELTTKMMMFKAIASFAGIFADGGMTNIVGFANGGVTNVKKFASGGMLTGPTLFNSSSGLALAGEAGYEHLMPAARLSNGKWGVYAEGMGGNNNQFVINTNINVEGGSSGNAEDDNKLAATISEKVSQSIKDTVKAELVQQMRAGGLLNSNGNKRW